MPSGGEILEYLKSTWLDPIFQPHRAAFGHLALEGKDWPKALKEVLKPLQVKTSLEPEKERRLSTPHHTQAHGLPATAWSR